MAYQITAKIWIVGETPEEAQKVLEAVEALPGVEETDWLDGEPV